MLPLPTDRHFLIQCHLTCLRVPCGAWQRLKYCREPSLWEKENIRQVQTMALPSSIPESAYCHLIFFIKLFLFLYEKKPDVVNLKVKAFYQNATFLEIFQSLLGWEKRLRAYSHDYLQCCALQPVVIAPSVKTRHLIRLYCSQAGESTKLLNTSHLSRSNIQTPTGSQTEFVSKHREATDSLRYNRVSNSKPNWTKIPSHSF